jgi:ubiquitin-conjugating enzyme E2 Z
MLKSDSTDTKIVSPETVKRLARDVRQILKSPLTSNGIYYHHDEENLLKGYAMIIGPSETVYENGFYFFEFDYPHDYPSRPPKVMFRTNQDGIRFNPNLYTSGKVCISLLNTWRGEQWTSCQTISTILLTLCTLFTNEPLLNEPGVERKHKDFKTYNRIIEYANLDIAVFNIIEKSPKIYMPWFDMFYSDALSSFTSNLSSIKQNIENIVKRNKSYIQNDNLVATINIYRKSICLDYNNVITRFNNLNKKYSNSEQLKAWKPIPTIEIVKVEKRDQNEMLTLLDQLIGDVKPSGSSDDLFNSIIPPTPPKKITKSKTKKVVLKKKTVEKMKEI